MIYLSKGCVGDLSTEQRMRILRYGKEYLLTGTEAALWVNGHIGFAYTDAGWAIHRLERLGLAECEKLDSPDARYNILSRCLCCAVESGAMHLPLIGLERRAFSWIRDAGLHLSVPELVFLVEHGIAPSPELLYGENRQRLVETIYTTEDMLGDGIERRMAEAGCRDEVVDMVERLLKKGRLVLL